MTPSLLWSLPTGVLCPARLPQPCSVHHLLSRYLDISSVPRRSFFELLACFSRHELEREKLLEFISAQGQEEMHAYCSRPRRTILEVWVGFMCCPVWWGNEYAQAVQSGTDGVG